MRQTCADHYRDAVEIGGESAARFWLGVVEDVGRSLASGHLAPLKERIASMSRLKLLLGLLVAAMLEAGILALVLPSHRANAGVAGTPVADPILRLVLQLTMLGFTLAVYGALIVALARFVHSAVHAGQRPGWVRLWLVLAGVVSFYALLANVVRVLLPATSDGGIGGKMLLSTQPLMLIGVGGLIAGYTRSTMGRGVGTALLAGLCAGHAGQVISQLSWVLLVVIAWNTQGHTLLSSGMASDYALYLHQYPGHSPGVGSNLSCLSCLSCLSWTHFTDGTGFLIIFPLLGLTVEVPGAVFGCFIGVSRPRAEAPHPRVAAAEDAPVRPARFLLTLLLLAVLVRISAAEFSALGGDKRRYGFSDLVSTMTTHAFALWLLGFVAVLALVYLTERPQPARPTVVSARLAID
jgi:hypothetical protein